MPGIIHPTLPAVKNKQGIKNNFYKLAAVELSLQEAGERRRPVCLSVIYFIQSAEVYQ